MDKYREPQPTERKNATGAGNWEEISGEIKVIG